MAQEYVPKPGDLVRLKTGEGPVMVVDSIEPNPPGVVCRWFVGGELRQATFAAAALVKDDDPFPSRIFSQPLNPDTETP